MKKMSQYLRTTQGKMVAALGIIIVALFGYYFYAMGTGQINNVTEVIVSQDDHVRGALDGRVTLVEFGDLQCPACGAYEPIVRQLVKDNPTTLKVIFRHFPLVQIHSNALLAAKASEAAGLQGKFWEMHDILYDNQKQWSEGLNAREFIMEYAKTIGLDTTKFATDIENKDIEAKILAQYQERNKLGVQGTPTFFLNGKMIESPKSLEAFDALIKAAAK